MDIVDIHSHLFNVRYLPLAGIGQAYFPKVPRFIFRAAASVARWGAADDRGLEGAYTPLNSRWKREVGRRDLAEGFEEKFLERLVDELSPDELLDAEMRVFVEHYAEPTRLALFEAVHLDLHTRVASATLSETEVTGDTLRPAREAVRDALERFDAAEPDDRAPASRGVGEVHDLFDGLEGFFAFMQDLRDSEIGLRDRWADFSGGDGKRLQVHQMMDLEPTYGERPDYDYPRQIRRMRKLAKLSPGSVLGFVAYDPYRNDLELVRRALDDGFIGVKLYPGSGYRPFGNAHPDTTAYLERQLGMRGVTLDERLGRLYELCQAMCVCILAHCGEGGLERARDDDPPRFHEDDLMGPRGSGGLSDPRAWLDVADRWPGLRVCLGHAGGAHWFWKDEDMPELVATGDVAEIRKVYNFAYCTYLLCLKLRNFYCDFGHFTDVIREDARGVLLGRLKKLDPRFFKKAMYGSDFPMYNNKGSWGEYLGAWKAIFADEHLAPHTPAFFFDNALDFLDLAGFLERCGDHLTDEERYAFHGLLLAR